MNIKVNIECTPQEARSFMGLPDLTPVHDIYVRNVTEAMTNGVNADAMEAMLKSWGPMSEMSGKFFQTMVGQMTGSPKA